MFLYFIAIKISFVSKTAFSIYQVRLSNPFATKLVFTLCLPALKDVYFFVKCILRKTQLRYAIREINNSVQCFLWTPCIKPNVFEAKTLLNVSATFKVFFLTTKLVAEAAAGAAEVGNFSTDSASQILLKIKSKLDSNFFSAKISFKLISCFKKTRPKRCRKDLSNRY